jgi:hypothetical protein
MCVAYPFLPSGGWWWWYTPKFKKEKGKRRKNKPTFFFFLLFKKKKKKRQASSQMVRRPSRLSKLRTGRSGADQPTTSPLVLSLSVCVCVYFTPF